MACRMYEFVIHELPIMILTTVLNFLCRLEYRWYHRGRSVR